MALIDHLHCGRVIIFNSMLLKNRWAFCLDIAPYDQIVYRGLFGLKTVDKKTFLGFARVVDVFDYLDRPLTDIEKANLRMNHRSGLMRSCKYVDEYVDKLFKQAGIQLFVNPEEWAHEDITK